MNVRISLSIDTVGQGYQGSWTSPNQGGLPSDLRSCKVVRDSIFIKFGGLNASFAGRIVHGDTEELRGVWTQLSRTDLTFRRAEKYQGLLDAGVAKLHLVFKISASHEGLLATLISPDQGPNELAASNASDSAGHLHLEFEKLHATYDGKISADRQHITGTFTQGMVMPLELDRSTSLSTMRRPQEPQPPFPYPSENVTFPNSEQDVQLAATFTYPNGSGPFPVAVLIAGSGPNDRDESIFEHRPFLIIADYLARHGIASLRYDKRGIGMSTGSYADATTSNFASDAEAAVQYLLTRPEVDHHKIGLIGHSEGGSIAPMVAVRDSNVRFIVLLAGPGLRGDEIGRTQRWALARAAGFADSTAKDTTDFLSHIESIIVSAPVGAKVDPLLHQYVMHYRDSLLRTNDALRAKSEELDSAIDLIISRVQSPWMREFLRYDPAPVLKEVKCPVLAINGQLDAQVVPNDNISAIERALKEGQNPDVTTKIFPGLNHLFQHAKTGAFSEYATIEESFAPEVLDYMTQWIAAHTR
ncbi:MAG: alpha/beta fold hydrolase [Bacteroidota bacterium]|nr:alpha/beta fold hydrolase [Bacteroidota bacterium]